ncbi:MAG: hypothetical protein ABIQ77_05140 [Anaerolineales bacterium]
MSVQQYPDRSALKIDILRTELVYLYELRIRHTQWMNETDADDYEIYRLHREIVDLIKPVSHRFQTLLEELQEDPN